MTELMQASRQWATRPDDQRFVSKEALLEHLDSVRRNSRASVVSSRRVNAAPTDDGKGIQITGPNGHAYAPTNWAFSQLAQRASAPAGYLRTLPAPMAADCINYGLQYSRDIEDIGVLLQIGANGPQLTAATGPKYGRVWNSEVARACFDRMPDWTVPGIQGKALEQVTKQNTTLYASDRDMFVFLADEKNRVELPDRRAGQGGSFARGFMVSNSEVGKSRLWACAFFFDYVCQNRIIWGAEMVEQISIRHSAGAPDRWATEVAPALEQYRQQAGSTLTRAIEDARAKRVDNVSEWLAKRYSKDLAGALMAQHVQEEYRPIETLWDVSTALTAHARNIPYQDKRIELEREAGNLLKLAA